MAGKLFMMKSTIEFIAKRKADTLGKMRAVADKGSYIEFIYI
jgi:hypothetical protein